MLLGYRTLDYLAVVDDRPRHRVDLILRGEVRKLSGLDAIGADIVIFKSEAMGQAYRPRAVRSGGRDENLKVHRLGHLAQLLLRLGAES